MVLAPLRLDLPVLPECLSLNNAGTAEAEVVAEAEEAFRAIH